MAKIRTAFYNIFTTLLGTVKPSSRVAILSILVAILYLLSIITAIFLPPGFLTGLLGINVGGVTGADEPRAFLLISATIGAMIVTQIILFQRMKWF